MGLEAGEVESGLSRLAAKWGFDFRLLYESGGLLKFILYRRSRLLAVRAEASYCVMVEQMGYA